jgi:hypothetical protein
MITTLLALLLAQDPAALIGKLNAVDAVEAANAEADLLRQGEAAIAPLRAAATAEADSAKKRRLSTIADRLDARKSAVSLKAVDAWYAIFKGALQIGWAHLKTDDKEGKLQFVDEIRVKPSKDVEVFVKASQVCERDEYLTVSAVTLDVQSPEATVAATGRRKDDRLVFEANGETHAIRLARNTVTDLAVLRLVGLLPSTDEYPIEIFQIVKPKEPQAARFKAQLDETLSVDGRALKARSWLLLDGGDEDRTYWVDAAGRLVKARFGELEMRISTEEKAKDIDTK